MKPTAVSWFAGIGGFDIAFRRSGAEIAGACEIDSFARRVYAARFGTPAWFPEDIGDVRADDVPPADIWCGGFPCQDLSVAGRRTGWSGARSVLVFRLLDLYRDARTRPRWLLLENVPGLLSVRGGRDFGALLAALDDLGLVGAWTVLDAQRFGVPQRRRRVFILACDPGDGDPAEVLALAEGCAGHPAAGGEARTAPARSARRGAGGLEPARRDLTPFIVKSHNGCAKATHAHATDRAAPVDSAGGYAPGQGGTLIAGFLRHLGGGGPDDNEAQAGHLIVNNFGVHDAAPSLNAHGVRLDGDSESFVVASALTRSAGHHGRSSPRGDGSDNLDGSHANGGVPPAVFNWQTGGSKARVSYREGHTDALAAHQVPAVHSDGVRRLTPTECERLQGFPDGWTCLCGAAPYSTATCRCPDGPRYHALGNAVAVPVVEWIARRLAHDFGTLGRETQRAGDHPGRTMEATREPD